MGEEAGDHRPVVEHGDGTRDTAHGGRDHVGALHAHTAQCGHRGEAPVPRDAGARRGGAARPRQGQRHLYGCAAGGFLKGPVEDRALGEKSKDTGMPVAVSSAAVAEALRAFGAKRISLASPYAPWLNERLHLYSRRRASRSRPCRAWTRRTTPRDQRAHRGTDHGSGPAGDASDIRQLLELPDARDHREDGEKLGKPIVASNQASMWKMLRLLGDNRAVPGAGRLFRDA